MSVTFEVLTTVWGAGDPPEEFEGGENTVDRPSAAFLRLLAGAEAAGAVRIVDADARHLARMEKAVQSQEAGEAALAKAQGDWVEPDARWLPDGTRELVAPGRWTGPWQHGNLVQAVADREARLDQTDDDATRATLEAELAGLRARLDEIEEPS